MNAIFCVLTPPGKSALAVIGIAGPDAWALARAAFHRRRQDALPDRATPGDSFVGWLGDTASGGADEVVLLVTDDCLEFHCHGGPRVVEAVATYLEGQGGRLVTAAEWPGASPARDALMHAPTLRTASIALDQLQGAGRTERYVQLTALGQHLVHPWKVVLAGAPNVGKSSLMNALAGYTRCIVAPTPGTTRDVVSTVLALDGWPVELSDTAGLRGEASALEKAGIDQARAAIEDADLCLWIVDGAASPCWPDFDVPRRLLVINKIDLPPAWPHDSAPDAWRVSAHTGEGVAELSAAIGRFLVPHPPAPGEAVPL
jgi:tRNA modification GTPase